MICLKKNEVVHKNWYIVKHKFEIKKIRMWQRYEKYILNKYIKYS